MTQFEGNETLSLKYNEISLLIKDEIKQVYFAEKKENHQKVIIKQISLIKLDEKIKKMAKDEGIILSELEHPNIINWYEFNLDKDKETIIMEYGEGGDLSQKISEQKKKNEPFTEKQIIDWFIQICEGVKYIHDKKIIHRDLKPNNIFLTKDNKIKIGDFGLAKTLAFQNQAKTNVGAPAYLSPEILNDEPYDYKSDIWNLGIILYELTQLKHPFINDDIGVEKRVSFMKKGKFIEFNNTNYSDKLLNLIPNLLKVDLNERYNINQIIEVISSLKIEENLHLAKEYKILFNNL
jgi:NIMA (never in mitosis gene a)-related kinase